MRCLGFQLIWSSGVRHFCLSKNFFTVVVFQLCCVLPAGTTKRECNRSKDGVAGAEFDWNATHFQCVCGRVAWEGFHFGAEHTATANGRKSYRTWFTQQSNRNSTSHPPASVLWFLSHLPPEWDHPPQPLPALSSILFFQSPLTHSPSFPTPHPAPWVAHLHLTTLVHCHHTFTMLSLN